MPFRYVLANLLAKNPNAVGVMFVDDAGETVDLVSAEYAPFDLQVVGAYLGIYLRQVGEVLAQLSLGQARFMHFEQEGLHFHLAGLPDGYFLVMLEKSPAVVGRGRRAVQLAATQLTRELFP